MYLFIFVISVIGKLPNIFFHLFTTPQHVGTQFTPQPLYFGALLAIHHLSKCPNMAEVLQLTWG